MTKFERVALDHFLSEYPHAWNYDHVLEVLEGDYDDRIVVWSPFEGWDKDELVGKIDELRLILEHNFAERTEE